MSFPRRQVWVRVLAAVLVFAVLMSLADVTHVFGAYSPFALQAQSEALHARWQDMIAQGVPAAELAPLEQDWKRSQQFIVLGAGLNFWWFGTGPVVDGWQARTDAIWARDVGINRRAAIAADLDLHRALGSEPFGDRKQREADIAAATSPADYAALTFEWNLVAALVPVDRTIASAAGKVGDLGRQAQQLGIVSDPAAIVLSRAVSYSQLVPEDRLPVAGPLVADLLGLQGDLRSRVAAATLTAKAMSQANNEIGVAVTYGIGVSSFQAQLTSATQSFGTATTTDRFNQLTAGLNQVVSTLQASVNYLISQTHVISGVAFYYQIHSLSCEETATSMALTHQGIYLSQNQILAAMGADLRPMYVDGLGHVRWGDPYQSFVGNVNGSEHNYTGYQANYPPLVRVARAHGARIIAYGYMSAESIYARVIAGHPVVVWATWDWAWHPRHDYIAFDGQRVPWIGPNFDAHVYTVVGVKPGAVLVNDPIRGQYWVAKGSFAAAYSDFQEAIVFA